MFEDELNRLKASGLLRELKLIEKVSPTRISIAGKEYLLFCSNNYLGLANHPKVIEKAVQAAKEFGFGAGASRLISGHTVVHQELENKIAKFKSREAALVFSTGYMANVGLITALVDEEDAVIIDRLNHASIIDACRLSRAKLLVYPHKDMPALEGILNKSEKYKKRLIITDSLFSMDGDLAPLPKIVQLAKKYKAMTMIDEAHATGVIGENGKGAEEHFGIIGQIDIVMGTLSKALGSMGGFVAGSQELIDFLKNKARSFIYTTALPPPACAAALASLEIIEKEPELRTSLWNNVKYLTEKLKLLGYNLMGAESQIIPLLTGDADNTIKLSKPLFERGIFVSAIRPPTVPEGESRLRITVSAKHSKEDLECLASSLPGPTPA